MALNNRYEFMFFVECVNANPNGDPDMGNSPRIDPQDMHGYITDVAIKRRIRNYIELAYGDSEGMNIIMKNATNINKFIALAHENTKNESDGKTKNKVYAARQWICDNYYDVRTFGAVLSTGMNAGQVRGPVQMTFAKSLDSVLPMDIAITRMCIAENIKGASTYDDYQEAENKTDEAKLRTIGRKQFIPYGLYEARGFISANLADQTGFDENDLKKLFEAILNMYEHDRSASKGEMSVIAPIIIFKHEGTDSNEEQRIKQAKLGCASAHKLFELVHAEKKEDVEYPRSHRDYNISIDMDNVPAGIRIGFMTNPYDDILWDTIPNDCDLF